MTRSARHGDAFADDDPATLARRVAHVVAVLDRHDAAACAACASRVCGHAVLFSLAAGHEDAPLCVACLAEDLERPADAVRESLLQYVLSKDCLRHGWGLCGAREAASGGRLPTCPADAFPAGAPRGLVTPAATPSADATAAGDASWDAGDLGCGELVLELRRRVLALPHGAVLRLRALDPGAPEDLPSWCRLTGHALVRAAPPDYWIRRKD